MKTGRRKQKDVNKERKWTKRRKIERMVIKGRREDGLSCQAAGLQAPC